jgi:hypothetical protein
VINPNCRLGRTRMTYLLTNARNSSPEEVLPYAGSLDCAGIAASTTPRQQSQRRRGSNGEQPWRKIRLSCIAVSAGVEVVVVNSRTRLVCHGPPGRVGPGHIGQQGPLVVSHRAWGRAGVSGLSGGEGPGRRRGRISLCTGLLSGPRPPGWRRPGRNDPDRLRVSTPGGRGGTRGGARPG